MSNFPVLLVVVVWCAAIVWFDWTRRRIPNFLVAAGLCIALLGLVFQGQTPFGAKPMVSLAGAAAGLVVMLPMYALRVMAAGDVKLFAAIGALFGFWALLPVWLVASLLAGGHAVLCVTTRRLVPQHTVTPALDAFSRLPYGVHLAAGIAVVAIQPSLVMAFTPQAFV